MRNINHGCKKRKITSYKYGQRNSLGQRYKHFFLIEIHSMQDGTVTTSNGVTRKRSTKRLKHIQNLFRKNLQLIGVC